MKWVTAHNYKVQVYHLFSLFPHIQVPRWMNMVKNKKVNQWHDEPVRLTVLMYPLSTHIWPWQLSDSEDCNDAHASNSHENLSDVDVTTKTWTMAGWKAAHYIPAKSRACIISLKAQSPSLQRVLKAGICWITGDALWENCYERPFILSFRSYLILSRVISSNLCLYIWTLLLSYQGHMATAW